MNPEDVEQLIQGLIDDELTPDEFATLEAELLQNPEAMQLYLRFTKLHVGLENHCSFRAALDKTSLVQAERTAANRHRWIIGFSMLGATVALLAVSMWLLSASHSAVIAFVESSGESKSSITHKDGGQEDGLIQNNLFEGSRVHLTEGTLTGRFHSGVTFKATAPCDLTVLSASKVALAVGAVTVSVPESGKGFTVETPLQEVVDLGTLFAVSRSSSGEEEVHVFKGSVETFLRNSPGEAQTLLAGEASRLTQESGSQQIAANKNRFITSFARTVVVGSDSTWKLSTEVLPDVDGVAEWKSGVRTAPPASDTFTLPVVVGESDVITAAVATRLGVEPIQSGQDVTYYRTSFVLDDFLSASAKIQLAVDNSAAVWINGHLIAAETSYSSLPDNPANWTPPLPSFEIGMDGSISNVVKFDTTSPFTDFKQGRNELILALRNTTFRKGGRYPDFGGFTFRMQVETIDP